MIIHVITCLEIGGAEIFLLKLLTYLKKTNINSIVISLSGRGKIAEQIENLGYTVIPLKHTYFFPLTLIKLYFIMRKYKPSIVQTWMYHSDLLGGIAAKLNGINKIYWNITAACFDSNLIKRSTRLVMKLSAWLSRYIPQKIVCCSKIGILEHTKFGYVSDKFVYIPNGINIGDFEFDPHQRALYRKNWKIDETSIIVGSTIKHSLIKGYDIFLKAQKIIMEINSNIKFVLAGRGLSVNNKVLSQELNDLELNNKVLLLDEINDVKGFLSAIDIFVLPSRSEAFPIALGEAMACKRACITTNVADAPYLLSDTGLVVEANNPEKLAEAILSLVSLSKDELEKMGARALNRIKTNFMHADIANQYLYLYSDVT